MCKTLERVCELLALVVLLGCYNTNNVKNGGLTCGKDGACPEGFVCKGNDGQLAAAGSCWKNGTGPDVGGGTSPDASDRRADASGTGPRADGGSGLACTVEAQPYGPFANCSVSLPPNSTCDPVCQTGCPCNQRCILDPTFSFFLCEGSTVPAGTTFIQPLGACNGDNLGLCAPGAVCTSDPVCQNACYKTCRIDEDCGSNSRCTANTIYDNNQNPLENVLLCSPPGENCNPTGSATCSPSRANFNCVFLGGLIGDANESNTTCDCASSHTVDIGHPCTTAPDNCKPGLVCVIDSCRTVCNLKGSGSSCTGGGGCTPIFGSQSYGYCR